MLAAVKGTVSGPLSGAEVVGVYDGATRVGTATVAGTSWSFTPTAELSAGAHSFTAKVENLAAVNASSASSAFSLNTQHLQLAAVVDHVGVVQGNILTLNSDGSLGTPAVLWTDDPQVMFQVRADLQAGQKLVVYDNGNLPVDITSYGGGGGIYNFIPTNSLGAGSLNVERFEIQTSSGATLLTLPVTVRR